MKEPDLFYMAVVGKTTGLILVWSVFVDLNTYEMQLSTFSWTGVGVSEC